MHLHDIILYQMISLWYGQAYSDQPLLAVYGVTVETEIIGQLLRLM